MQLKSYLTLPTPLSTYTSLCPLKRDLVSGQQKQTTLSELSADI